MRRWPTSPLGRTVRLGGKKQKSEFWEILKQKSPTVLPMCIGTDELKRAKTDSSLKIVGWFCGHGSSWDLSLQNQPTIRKKEKKMTEHNWVQSSHTSAHCTWCGQKYPGDSSCVPSGEGKKRYENYLLYKEKYNIEEELKESIKRRLQPCGGVSVKIISGDISRFRLSKNKIIEKIIEIFPYGEGEISEEKFNISYSSFPGGGSSYPGFGFEISLL